ncbi:SusC/RagA family TonB-linked outer membrane protein [Adhaeribacter rhizoryzae]|uniref:TonB-dependent receptor n=1 Tax=Adhaeribacter rhizoryzae TaxID=2607907 RepID=A0A5M6D1S5_9BACT|nr:TonB-dependent receptor [Adhaeribacter rhizoryzae]KAA5541283.1 TonB-dependent receptor [Adhaeribacter rhizoryzae]
MKRIFYLVMLFLGAAQILYAQNSITVSGKVTSEIGEPMPGVSLAIKGTTSGTTTNADGTFSVSVPNPNAVLVVSFIGYTNQEVPVNNQTTLNITLQPDAKALEEVVVTGYQTEKKADLTGAVAVVNLTQVKDIPAGNPMRTLQGRVPGLYVEATGQPNGGNSRVLIRGLNTLGDPNPLYVIDGVPTKDAQVFASINPSSIASVQVLKDASAASIYGARASNGVIIVTTKDGKGKEGQERISVQFNSNVSVQSEKPWREDVLTAEERGRALWQGAVNDRTNPTSALYTYDWNNDFNNPVLNKVNIVPIVGGDPLQPAGNTDWQDAAYERAIVTQQDLTLTAGTNKSSLLINLGYFKNTGMLKYTNFDRYSTRINAYTTFLNDKVKIGENLQLSRSSETLQVNDLGGVPTTELAVTLAPTLPVLRTDGTYAGPIGAGYSDRNNPVHMQYLNRWDKNNRLNAIGNIYAEVTPKKGLVFRTSLGADYSNSLFKNIEPAFQEGFLGRDINSLSLQQGNELTLTWANTANYQFEVGQHRINALAGTEAIRNDFQGFGAFREGFTTEDENYYVLNAGTGRSTNNGMVTGYRLFSLFGKVNYAYGEKYLASVTLRRDGSSRFGSENQFGLFPAFTLGWRINEEEFLKNIGAISNLKLRAGVGRVGNQEIGNIARYGLYQPNYGTRIGDHLNTGTAYDLNGANQGTLPSGYVQIQGENQSLKWESTNELNVGVDFGFLNEKLSGSFDYFTRRTEDILIQPPVASAVGEGRVKWLNGATKSNKGWEMLLTYQNTTPGGINYSITGNAAHFKDKITELPAEVRTAYPGSVEKSIIGQSQLAVFGYKTNGIFQNQAEVDAHAMQTGKDVGRIRYVDLNNDGVINASDRDWLGTLLPSMEYGLRVDVAYKNFDLSVFGSGVAGKTGFDPARQFNSFLTVNQNNGPGVLNAWTPQNTSSNTPMLSLVNKNDEYRTSDFFMINGSYAKLRNVQLGYTLPAELTSRVKMQTLRFYLIGQNLFAIKSKEYLGKDPERIGGFGNWPQPTSYTLGVNVAF